VRELDDGRVLLHDFGGCETGDVLAALGLEMQDLFEKPLGHHFPASKSRVPARDLIDLIDHEVTVAALIVADILQHHTADEPQWARLAEAAARIGRARDHGHA
jgi:light-regulated signal transduction histidine kinase (bacteriophytochrome)